MRELERAVRVSLAGITYHVRVLEAAGKVVGISDGHYRRFFLSTLVLVGESRRLNEEDRKLLAECRRPASLAIILNLAVDGPLRHRDLEVRLGRTKGTLSFHLSRLMNLGIVSRAPVSSAEGYAVANLSRVLSLLVTFSASLSDRVDAFANLWLSLGRREPPPRQNPRP